MLSEPDKALLNSVRVKLMEGILLNDSTILKDLQRREVITAQNVQVLKTEPGNINQVGALLDIVERGDEDALDHLIHALLNTGKAHAMLAKQYLRVPRKDKCPAPVPREVDSSSSSTQGADENAQDEEDMEFDEDYKVEVKACTRQFYKEHCDEAYDMDRMTRGKVLIININKVKSKKPRRGTDVDADKLNSLFEQLQMDVQVFNDGHGLTADGIIEKVREFASPDNHKKSQCCVLVLLSHGKETKDGPQISGTDGEPVSVRGLRQHLLQCNTLQDVPKLVLIQACRVERDGDDDERINDEVVCYATKKGDRAVRYTSTGSRFIKAVVTVFEEQARNTDVGDMMEEVKLRVINSSPKNEIQEPDIAQNTLSKKWYLFPKCPLTD